MFESVLHAREGRKELADERSMMERSRTDAALVTSLEN